MNAIVVQYGMHWNGNPEIAGSCLCTA